MKKQRILASLTAAALAAASLPAVAASSVEYNTWTGYVLRNAAGNCLSVLGGSEGEGAQVDFYLADGAAPYNTWYFTETDTGITVKSALSQGEYYHFYYRAAPAAMIICFRPGADNCLNFILCISK